MAEEQGWPIRDFHRPVRMRTRLASAVPGPRASVTAVSAAGVAAVLIWVVLRSRAAAALRCPREDRPARAGSVLLVGACDGIRQAPTQDPSVTEPGSGGEACAAFEDNGARAQRFEVDGACVPGDVLVLYRCAPTAVPVLRLLGEGPVVPRRSIRRPGEPLPPRVRFAGAAGGTEVLIADRSRCRRPRRPDRRASQRARRWRDFPSSSRSDSSTSARRAGRSGGSGSRVGGRSTSRSCG